MSIEPIIQNPNRILHTQPQPLTVFGNSELKTLIQNMKDTLIEQDGLGLAAPQIGVSLSIFIIPEEYAPKVRTLSVPRSLFKPLYPTVFINPSIISYGTEKELIEEGCLSVKDVYHQIARSYEVTIAAQNEKGQKFRVKAKGLLARIFQHETDHLNGILFLDRLHEK